MQRDILLRNVATNISVCLVAGVLETAFLVYVSLAFILAVSFLFTRIFPTKDTSKDSEH